MSDRGSALPVVLGLALAGALVLGVAVDLARWASAHREAAAVADAAAQAGAVELSELELRNARVVVDEQAATVAARALAGRSRPRPGRTVDVTIAAGEVCVLVSQPFSSRVLGALGVDPGLVVVEGCAVPMRG